MKTFTKERKIRDDIVQRCTNVKNTAYKDYGARGITICEEWSNNETGFAKFIEYMGPCPDKQTIDRINNDKNYEPGNVKWATRSEQARNRRSNNNITHNGRTQCLQAWANEAGLTHTCLLWRINAGWDFEKAITTKSSPQQEGINDKARQDTGMHLEHKGENLSLRQWAVKTGIQMQTIRNRIRKGLTSSQVLAVKLHGKKA